MIPTVVTVPLQHLASGDRLFLQVYRFVGRALGKKAYLQANLHGAEIAGNVVIHELLNWLHEIPAEHLQGEICLVPVCNPTGVNQRTFHFSTGRFNPYDGRDWNRIFWDYEHHEPDLLTFARSQLGRSPEAIQQAYRQRMGLAFEDWVAKRRSPAGMSSSDRLAYCLQSLAWDADYLLDLHSSADRGLPYLYYFQGREESARLFHSPIAILLNEYDGDAFDEAFIKPWLALETCLTALGQPTRFEIESWTLELGTSMALDTDAVQQGINGIKHYLIQKGMVRLDPTPLAPASAPRFTSRQQMRRYFAPTGGIIQWRSPLGTPVAAGDPLYRLLSFNKTTDLPQVIEVCAEKPGFVLDLSINHAVNEGEYVLYLVETP